MIKEIQTARDASYLLFLEWYCEEPHCPVREVRVKCKDHDKTLMTLVGNRPSCPLCAARLKFHWVRTSIEQEQYEERQARMSVNQQIWQAAHPDELFIPVSAMVLDRLPTDSMTDDDCFGTDDPDVLGKLLEKFHALVEQIKLYSDRENALASANRCECPVITGITE